MDVEQQVAKHYGRAGLEALSRPPRAARTSTSSPLRACRRPHDSLGCTRRRSSLPRIWAEHIMHLLDVGSGIGGPRAPSPTLSAA